MSNREKTGFVWPGALALALIFALHAPAAWGQVVADDVVCAGCVQGTDIQNGTIGPGKLIPGSINATTIANGVIGPNKLIPGSINQTTIAADAIRSNKILDGAVQGADIADGAVTGAKLAADVEQRLSDLEAVAQENLPFYITLDTAEGTSIDATIATNGPLEYIARCTDNGTGNMDKLEIIATSSAATWFEERTVVAEANGPGDEVVGMSRDEPNGSLLYEDFGHGSSSVADDGSFLAIIRFGMGLNIFGHDCLVVGTAEAISGAL